MPQAISNLHDDSFPANDSRCALRSFPAPLIRTHLVDGAPWYFADDIAAAMGMWSLAELDRRTAAMGPSFRAKAALLTRDFKVCFITVLSRAGAEALSYCRKGTHAEEFRQWLMMQPHQ